MTCRVGELDGGFLERWGVSSRGVRDRLWNLERFIVFQTVTLQRAQRVTTSQAIRQRIEKRLDAWGEVKHAILVEDTLCTSTQYLTINQREETAEHRAQTYHCLVLWGTE